MVTWLLLGGFQFGRLPDFTPSIEPEARVIADAVQSTYEKLDSIRFATVPNYAGVPVTKVAYRRSGGLLVQFLDDRDGKVVAEYRELGSKGILSSPENRKCYLRQKINPRNPFWNIPRNLGFLDRGREALSQIYAASLGVDSKSPTPYGIVALRLGERGTSVDGVPVDRLEVDRYYSNPQMHAPRWSETKTVYCVGVNDHLLRRVEHSGTDLSHKPGDPAFGAVPRKSDVAFTEYHGVVANEPIPNSTFEFHPAPGQTGKDSEPPGEDPTRPPSYEVVNAMNETMRSIKSLSFVSDSVTTQRTLGPKAPSTVSYRAVTRFDLQRPFLAYGEMSLNGGPVGLIVVSDGQQVRSRGGTSDRWSNAFYDESISTRIRTFDYRSLKGSMGLGARAMLNTFLQVGQGDIHYEVFSEFRSAARKRVGAETFDVLEKSTEPVDRFGIPTGDLLTVRFLIGQKDHLIHGYESDQTYEVDGKSVLYTVRETFSRVAANVTFLPSRFKIQS